MPGSDCRVVWRTLPSWNLTAEPRDTEATDDD
jgi:hypothetical protein